MVCSLSQKLSSSCCDPLRLPAFTTTLIHQYASVNDQTQAALSASRRHEQAATSLSWELESMQRLKDDAIAELQQQCSVLKQQLQVCYGV